MIFNSDIQLSFFLLFVFYICLSVCRLLKAMYDENAHIVFCLVDIKVFIFNLLCVLICGANSWNY